MNYVKLMYSIEHGIPGGSEGSLPEFEFPLGRLLDEFPRASHATSLCLCFPHEIQ